MNNEHCPCGSGNPSQICCQPFLAGELLPHSPEQLMRSRYTAFVLQNEAYLLSTWHPHTRPARLGLADATSPKWIGLEVKRAESTGAEGAIVEFVARERAAFAEIL